MGLLGERSLVRRRAAAGSRTGGRWTAGTVTTSTFTGSVQPMSGKERQVLPEGLRHRDGKKVYCDRGTLRIDDQHAQLPGDVVDIDGVYYTVVHLDNEHPLLEHDRAYLVREQEAHPAPVEPTP